MKIEINWQNEGFRFQGEDSRGHQVQIDGNNERGVSPLSLLLHAAGACSGVDIVDILGKMRQPLEGLKILVEGDRKEGEAPRPYTHIRLHFILSGELDEDKARRAVELSLDKYCSATANLRGVSEISGTFEIVAP